METQIKHPKCLIADFSKPEVNKLFVGLREAAEWGLGIGKRHCKVKSRETMYITFLSGFL